MRLQLLCAPLLVLAMPARAQVGDMRADAVPAVLTAIQPIAQSRGETRFRLSFAPHANGFAGLAETAQTHGVAALAFALTTRATSASLSARLDGFVHAISFEQADSVLIVHFATTASARAEARAINATDVEITVHALVPPQADAAPPRLAPPDDSDAIS